VFVSLFSEFIVSTNRKQKKHARKQQTSGVVVPLVSYQLAEDEDEAQPQLAVPVYGPFLPPQDTAPSSDEPADQLDKTVGCSASTTAETDEKPDKKAEVRKKGAKYDDEIEKLEAMREKLLKRSQHAKHSESKEDSDAGDTREASPVLETLEVAEMAGNFTEVASSMVEDEVAGEEIVPTSDEQMFVRFEYTNRRYEGDDDGPETAEEMELDAEDIDKELEMALERCQVSYTHSFQVYLLFERYYLKAGKCYTWIG